jgi:hypothetical protein
MTNANLGTHLCLHHQRSGRLSSSTHQLHTAAGSDWSHQQETAARRPVVTQLCSLCSRHGQSATCTQNSLRIALSQHHDAAVSSVRDADGAIRQHGNARGSLVRSRVAKAANSGVLHSLVVAEDLQLAILGASHQQRARRMHRDIGHGPGLKRAVRLALSCQNLRDSGRVSEKGQHKNSTST